MKARAGSWNGLQFSGTPSLRPNPVFEYEFVLNEREVYYKNKLLNTSVLTRFMLDPSGIAGRFTWIDRTQSWERFATAQLDQCEIYAFCGSYATCNPSNSIVCACLKGFVSKSRKDQNSVDCLTHLLPGLIRP
jgi:hypothetical protein